MITYEYVVVVEVFNNDFINNFIYIKTFTYKTETNFPVSKAMNYDKRIQFQWLRIRLTRMIHFMTRY